MKKKYNIIYMKNKIENTCQGRIIGLTTKNGKKYNGQIQAVGDITFVIYDRNKKRNCLLRHDEVDSVRGAPNN